MPAPRFTHLAVLVRHLEDAGKVFCDRLGLAPQALESLPSEGVRVMFIPIGLGAIELIEPLATNDPLQRFLAARGGAVHHVAIEVPDLDAAVVRARCAGFGLIGDAPRRGAHGTRVMFVHPRSTHGVLIELVEKSSDRHLEP
ncbi:MAG TPA: methylmalonyl-CoA epimerase [bacterium]|nr:methylmalonyl-CoA epimerase [bacterium]